VSGYLQYPVSVLQEVAHTTPAFKQEGRQTPNGEPGTVSQT
jgi:hypothetical protein